VKKRDPYWQCDLNPCGILMEQQGNLAAQEAEVFKAKQENHMK